MYIPLEKTCRICKERCCQSILSAFLLSSCIVYHTSQISPSHFLIFRLLSLLVVSGAFWGMLCKCHLDFCFDSVHLSIIDLTVLLPKAYRHPYPRLGRSLSLLIPVWYERIFLSIEFKDYVHTLHASMFANYCYKILTTNVVVANN